MATSVQTTAAQNIARKARNRAARARTAIEPGVALARRIPGPVLAFAGAGVALVMVYRWLSNRPGMKGLADFSQRLVWPLSAGSFRLGSGYGWRLSPVGLPVPEYHSGQDLSAATGTPVSAIADGVVTFAGERGGYGNSVIIDHGNGIATTYNHLNSISVAKGAQVAQGTRLGTVGSTGRSTGPHLHFEVVDAKYPSVTRDPIQYLPPV